MTVKELAQELQVDKQRIYRYLKKNYADKLKTGSKGAWIVTKELEKIIREEFSYPETDDTDNSDINTDATNNTIQHDTDNPVLQKLIQMLEDDLKAFKKELEVKNEQIAELTREKKELLEANKELTLTVKGLNQSVINEQILHRESLSNPERETDNTDFETVEINATDVDTSETDCSDEPKEEPQKKKRFWFFGK